MSDSSRRPTVLVVDDKKNMLGLMTKVLRADARVLAANDGQKALKLLQEHAVDVVLCDLRMPDMDGTEVLRECKKLSPHTEFVLMTAYASVETAVEALRRGAFDYLTKPFEPEEARAVIMRAAGRAATNVPGDGNRDSDEVLPGLLSRSQSMISLGGLVRQVAASDATVLLLGETGTGKERIARAVHRLSPRSGQRFVAVNCAAIPAELIESELFGHTRGAFTGAARDKAGLFEEATQGTLFLDEIGELRLSLQAKLTRALEERSVRRLGESVERPVDARLIAATHRDIEQMIADGGFREDLWYRLNVATIRIPPLRDRREDIELLATHFLRERTLSSGKRLAGFTAGALDVLEHFNWPGNVRQLRAAIERASVVCTTGRVDIGDLPPEIVGARRSDTALSLAELTWAEARKKGRVEFGRQYLTEVLRRFDGHVGDAAKHAGVERESFYRLMRRFGVEPELRPRSRRDKS